ncbi:hypothetical protein [Terrabacter sp. 2RAF25]|uniref:hypothetical protein n=1 Tax=Terrabacter sp. 2RAF25 TaxID=3232998 RepID=UPI003F996EA4
MTADERAASPDRRTGLVRAVDLADVLVYLVVLNLAVQLVPAILSESFTLTLLTAVLLKGVLEVVVRVKTRARRRLGEARTPRARVVAALLLWLVLVGSKLVVLELVALSFGDAVHLGGFVSVTGLIAVLLLARAAVRRLLAPEVPATDGSPDAGRLAGHGTFGE